MNGNEGANCLANLLRNKFLHAHAVVDVANIDGAIFADGEVVAPVDLAVVIAEAAPLGEDFSGEIEFEELAAIDSRGFEIAAVNDVEKIVRADGERPGAAEFAGLPHF